MRRYVDLVAATAVIVLLTVATADAQKPQSKTHLGGKASNLIALIGTAGTDGSINDTQLIDANGGNAGDFVIPNKSVLVVTDVHVIPTGTPGLRSGRLRNPGGGGLRTRWEFDSATHGAQYINLGSGSVFRQAPQVQGFAASAGTASVYIYGYLTRDK